MLEKIKLFPDEWYTHNCTSTEKWQFVFDIMLSFFGFETCQVFVSLKVAIYLVIIFGLNLKWGGGEGVGGVSVYQ